MTLRRRYDPSDDGIGMVFAIIVATLMLAMAATAFMLATTTVRGSGEHVRYETALHVAEHGIDQSIARLQKDEAFHTVGDIPRFATSADEESWLAAQLAAVSTTTCVDDAPCVQSTGRGDFVVLKPCNFDDVSAPAGTCLNKTIYSAAFLPSKAEATRVRILKAEYLRSTYSPDYAILAGGEPGETGLLISGTSAEVLGSLGSIHTNGDLEFTGSAHPTIDGTATATGSCDPQCDDYADGSGGGKPAATVPVINPRDLYELYAGDASLSWYDMCPDGIVRRPVFGGTPCSGSTTVDPASIGWSYHSSTWSYSPGGSPTPPTGVFYGYQVDVKITKGGTAAAPWEATIITEGEPSSAVTDCQELMNGDIAISGSPVINGYLTQIVFLAGRDLGIAGTPSQSFEGLLAAHEQVDISGNPSVLGAVLAENGCDSSESPKLAGPESEISGNMSLTYDDEINVALGNLVRTTLWLEV